MRSREWLELSEFSFSICMEKLHKVHSRGKVVELVTRKKKKKKNSTSHLCLLSVFTTTGTVGHGYTQSKGKSRYHLIKLNSKDKYRI